VAEALTADEVLALPATVDILTAGRALGIGRSTAYQLVRTDRFPCPVIRVGQSWRVPTAGLRHLLGLDNAADNAPHGEGHPDGSTPGPALALDAVTERGSTRPPADSTITRPHSSSAFGRR
jgi:predicted DNA-binding transcriptional regulator AlpA